MKRYLLFVLLAFLPVEAFALCSRWLPAEKPIAGPLGAGVGYKVDGMMRYETPPSRPYEIIGYIKASSGLFGSPRTRAVAVARKHNADAILLVDSQTSISGASFQANTWHYGQNLDSTGGNVQVHQQVIATYAAIRWTK
ncbi:MAG: hypothetical protein AB7T14_03980 [Candidatus Methylacidiphilaceae bacterium]